jgi:hypothetical protein
MEVRVHDNSTNDTMKHINKSEPFFICVPPLVASTLLRRLYQVLGSMVMPSYNSGSPAMRPETDIV